jgi:hypothetical protein
MKQLVLSIIVKCPRSKDEIEVQKVCYFCKQFFGFTNDGSKVQLQCAYKKTKD